MTDRDEARAAMDRRCKEDDQIAENWQLVAYIAVVVLAMYGLIKILSA